MDQEIKKQLKKLYEAPKPVGKRTFFRKMEMQPLNIGNILWVQCSYITKWEWILSAVLLGGTVMTSIFFEAYILSVVLIMVPFLAVVSVSESIRSITWGMNELEMSARFSLKSIVLARMAITGMANIILELLVALLAGGNFWETVLYLLSPYLLTACGSLILVRNITGGECIYACAGFGVFVGMMAGFSTLRYGWIYQTQYTGFWFMAACFLACLTFKESRQNIRRLELNYDNL